MTALLTVERLVQAVSPGGPSCLSSTTELAPAGGPQCAIAPAKFAMPRSALGTYAYERRYLDGELRQAVIVDSKQSQLNRAETALQQAIDDGHPLLGRLPRVEVTYQRGDTAERHTDLTLPHRVFDAHIRAGTVEGDAVTAVPVYRAARDATAAAARALLELSPITLVYGGWDSSRAARQGRWRSVLVGEVLGFCDTIETPKRGGARVDGVGMRISLPGPVLAEIAETQRAELSGKTYDKVIKEAGKLAKGATVSASMLGLGGIPPTLEQLAGVACDRIIRSHVLSFAALRQLRFGAGPEGDAACRAVLAALALNGLARSDAELCLRANCDLIEAGPTVVRIDQRGGRTEELAPLDIAGADRLLAEALAVAESAAGLRWDGVALRVAGNPGIVAGAVDDADGGEGSQ
ncbi:type I-U CRISPR-associated RAMP protein Csb1/Cas7u [Lentzea sp. NPDC004782]|uniref:type I-G CRISPR-associated RAMP protein Csb1/Cas7g n=1 Tax=Lentzea sp. NPDC004782 TaxID=3154458 RepID=UPI0033B29035